MFDRLAFSFAAFAAVTLTLDGVRAQSTEPVFYPGTNEGLFLIVTDIHFDPFSDPALVPELDKSPVSGWTEIFKGAAESIKSYGNDASYSLMVSALDAAAAQGDRARIDPVNDYSIQSAAGKGTHQGNNVADINSGGDLKAMRAEENDGAWRD